MKEWTRWMPLAFVVWFSRRKLERIPTPYGVIVAPFDDVYIKVDEP